MTALEPTRHADRAVQDRRALDALLDRCRVAHVALVTEDGPLVLPTAYARVGDRLVMHGSPRSRWMGLATAGAPVCAAVTELSALVVGRAAGTASMHYASAVLFGTCVTLAGEDKAAALAAFTASLVPGAAHLRPAADDDLAATLVLALPIERWSLKVAADWPHDDPADVAGPAWAGVLPLVPTWGEPVPAPDLRDGVQLPDELRSLVGQPANDERGRPVPPAPTAASPPTTASRGPRGRARPASTD